MKLPLLLSVLLIVAPLAHAQHKHVHGEGTLNVVIDGESIKIELEMPLDAAVGFEHAPKTFKQKAALAETEALLKDAEALFKPNAEADCLESNIEVTMPFFTSGEHADIDAEYMYTCGNPSALKNIETTLFAKFKRLYRLEVQRSGPNGQGAQRLTPKKPVLTW
jgi:hypothetical protein